MGLIEYKCGKVLPFVIWLIVYRIMKKKNEAFLFCVVWREGKLIEYILPDNGN